MNERKNGSVCFDFFILLISLNDIFSKQCLILNAYSIQNLETKQIFEIATKESALWHMHQQLITAIIYSGKTLQI